MKRCWQCDNENPDSMNFCLNCGNSLQNQPMNFNLDNKQTVELPNETETVVAREGAFPTNFFRGQIPPQDTSRKILPIFGGIMAILVLFGIASASVTYYVLKPSTPDPKPTPAPSPIVAKSPVPVISPITTPSVSPVTTPTATPNISPTPASALIPRADFNRMWVDFNVTENGRRGMRIHISFTTYNMKDLDSYLAVYFQHADGTSILTNNRKFASERGELALYHVVKPAYEPALFKDLQLFMPYSEFTLRPGKYNLKMNARLIYKKGGLIQHLTSYNFVFTQN